MARPADRDGDPLSKWRLPHHQWYSQNCTLTLQKVRCFRNILCPQLKCVKKKRKKQIKASILFVLRLLKPGAVRTQLICMCLKFCVPTDIVMSLSLMSCGVRSSWFSTRLLSPWQSSSRYVISYSTIYENYLGIVTHWWHVIVRSTCVGFNWAQIWRLVLYIHSVSNLSRFYFRPLLSFVRPMLQMSMPWRSSFPP